MHVYSCLFKGIYTLFGNSTSQPRESLNNCLGSFSMALYRRVCIHFRNHGKLYNVGQRKSALPHYASINLSIIGVVSMRELCQHNR